MGLGCLIELGEIWMRESFDRKGLPDEVCSGFTERYGLSLGHRVAREVTSMAISMLASIGGQAWECQGETKRNVTRSDFLTGARDCTGLLEGGKRGKPAKLKSRLILMPTLLVSVIMRSRARKRSSRGQAVGQVKSCAEEAARRGVGS